MSLLENNFFVCSAFWNLVILTQKLHTPFWQASNPYEYWLF